MEKVCSRTTFRTYLVIFGNDFVFEESKKVLVIILILSELSQSFHIYSRFILKIFFWNRSRTYLPKHEYRTVLELFDVLEEFQNCSNF